MNTYAQTLTGLYAKHSGAIRGAMYALIMVGILAWILIGNAVPSHAATLQTVGAVPGDIIDPVKPDSTSFGETILAVVARVFATILYAFTVVAIFVALLNTAYWLGALGAKSERASNSRYARNILIAVAIAGVLGTGGTWIYVATAGAFGSVISG